MRFHVVALPHTETTKEYLSCAYTQKTIKFCKMMKDRGHTVFLYAAKNNEAVCDEVINCTDAVVPSTEDYTSFPFTIGSEPWTKMNKRAIEEINKRKQPQDFVCLIAGLCQKEIADGVDLMSVEYGIGYGGVFAPYKVFESYAWMHTVYGSQNKNAHAIDGKFYDAVIPNFFDVSEFPFNQWKEDYYLYIGRLTDRKGLNIAQEVCKRLDKRLVVAGSGEFKGYGEYVGSVGVEKRGELLSKAIAVFCPTLYIEPFGGIAVEAMLCGTPVITTDWGAFTETVQQGLTGFRCHTLQGFMDAAEKVKELNPAIIRGYAVKKYSMENIAPQYESYFKRLLTLFVDGWYTTET